MHSDPPPKALVLDANVLIDYWHGNRGLLSAISIHIAPISIPGQVFDEVEQITKKACRTLNIEVVEFELEELLDLSAKRSGLSLADQLCVILAKRLSATCVTNDGRLRRECQASNIPVVRGLQPLLALVESEHVDPKVARRAVRKMQAANPRYISQAVVEEFLRRVGSVE